MTHTSREAVAPLVVDVPFILLIASNVLCTGILLLSLLSLLLLLLPSYVFFTSFGKNCTGTNSSK